MLSGLSIINVDPPKPSPDGTVHSGEFEEPTDFETAIRETGFGRFNFFTIAVGGICCLGSMSETTVMSLIFPRAQCDLNLSLSDKGALNGIVYIGMISSAILWGFMADVLGRKKILMYGYVCTGCFNIVSGLSQNFWTLLFAKFCSGFM